MSALREIVASFGIEFDKEGNLAKGDKHVESLTEKLAEFGKGVAAAFAVEKIFEFGHEILEQADAVAKQSEALGVSAEQLQGWQHAAQLSGSSAEEFTAAFTKFTRNVHEASEAAAGPAAKAFKALGVDIKNSSGDLGAPIDLLDGVVAGLQGIEDPAKRTALVMDLFGKSGARLLPLLSEGPEGIKKLREEVKELGFGFDEAFLENAQEVNDNVDRLKGGMRGLAIQVLGPILPGLVKLTQGAVAIAKSFIGWIKNTTLVQGVVGALAGKSLPLLMSGLRSLGALALRTVLPFLLLDDVIGFLAGDDSELGAMLDKIFGAGTAEAARKEILQWFTDVKNVVSGELLPALKGIVESPLFQGAAKGALDAILAVLRAIGLALTDDEERAKELAKALQGNLAALGLGPSEEEAQKKLEEGLPENRKELTGAESFTRKVVTTIFGDPLDNPEVKANEERNREILEKQRLEKEGIVAAPAAPPQPKEDWAAAFQTASAPAPAPASFFDQSQTTVAPVANVTVNVQGDADLANRVGKVTAKAVNDTSLRGVKDALVPTPG